MRIILSPFTVRVFARQTFAAEDACNDSSECQQHVAFAARSSRQPQLDPSLHIDIDVLIMPGMAIRITIRDVPEKVRDKLVAQATLQGKSLQAYLRVELERLVARPSMHDWLQRVRKRKRMSQARISSKEILKIREIEHRRRNAP